MRGYDLFLLAAIVATFFLTLAGLLTQKYLRLFDVFFGKKQGFWIYVILVAFGWLEVIATSVIVFWSSWQFHSLWYLGVPVVAFAVWLFVTSVTRPQPGIAVCRCRRGQIC